MGKVILLPQPLHPFRGRLRIEHEDKNVSIDTLKVVIKLNELLLKNHNIFLSYNQRPTPSFAQCTNRSAGTLHLLRHTLQKHCPALSHV
jgi:hypothetical protein